MKSGRETGGAGWSAADDLPRRAAYLNQLVERDAAKVLQLGSQCIRLRNELEQKRRGFALLADLAVNLQRSVNHESLFLAVGRRVNAALNMQRTAVLLPEPEGCFRAKVLQGYTPEQQKRILAKDVNLGGLLGTQKPVLVTGADPAERLAGLRRDLDLPYLIIAPVVLDENIVAVIITGRLVEQEPYLIRLSQHDVENVQTVSAYLAAILAEARMLKAEERIQIMLDATPMGCNFWDENLRNVDCNQESVRLFGASDKREYLEKFIEFSPECQPDGSRSSDMIKFRLEEAFSKGWIRFEWMHRRLDGEMLPCEITLVRSWGGGSNIVLGYVRDLREEKAMLANIEKTQHELRAAKEQAEKSARAKSEFLANMSHEIRTPLHGVMGMLHMLGGTQLTEKQHFYMEQAEHSARLLLRVINDILDFSKIEAGRLEMEEIEFSLPTLMHNIRTLLGDQAGSKGLNLNVSIDPAVPDTVKGDPVRLEQVLWNLVSNALKFTKTGGIEICVYRGQGAKLPGGPEEREEFLFEVEDTGIGLEAGMASRLFTPFTQADASFTRKFGGTGLGLAICRSLVEMMGGKIWCESEPGQGSKFSFTACFGRPASDEAGASGGPEGVEETAAAGASLQGLRVLLAEDNEINRMIALDLLHDKGIVVEEVSSGLEALDALEKGSYDLVLMDIQMPEMDGLTATTHIRSNPKFDELPVIAMTAHAMSGDREISLDLGMNDHLTKPIRPELLYAALERWDRRKK